MPEFKKPLRLTPTGLVLVPFAVLSLISAGIAAVAFSGNTIAFASPKALLIAGALIYAATIFLLTRSGVANVRELETLGSTDALTQLPNRRALSKDIKTQSQSGDEIAVALIDLDSFKQVNDRYGHSFGDQLIQECARLLQDVCSKEAECYRLGGDEFAVVMHGRVAGTILEGLCRAVLERLNTAIEVDGRSVVVGASIGLARSTDQARVPPSEMLRRADVAMYRSKQGGKMRCTWFNATFDERREAMRELEDGLRNGLSKGEFSLAYQPLVDAQKGKIVAVEALLRWQREDASMVGPNVFIPVAEETGLINPIGLWALREAVRQAGRWDGIILSVNISVAQLRDPEFPFKLGEILEETGFPAERLELEVTETCLVLDPVTAERSLNVIREFGVRISLDDFGTGYASIGFLRQFRFEKLKIDRSLVVQAGDDDSSRAMMISSVALARALDMGVTAEGVETEEQAELVRLAGCDQIQGWLYYKAMSATEIDDLFLAQSAKSQSLNNNSPSGAKDNQISVQNETENGRKTGGQAA